MFSMQGGIAYVYISTKQQGYGNEYFTIFRDDAGLCGVTDGTIMIIKRLFCTNTRGDFIVKPTHVRGANYHNGHRYPHHLTFEKSQLISFLNRQNKG